MTSTRLTVNLGALRANYRRIADALRARDPGGPAPAAVVKADAYGLGARAVAAALVEEGCDNYFVATTREGCALRDVAACQRIHVFSGPLDEADARAMAENRLVPVLNDERQVGLWRRHHPLPAALHVDTGMHRLGFPHDSARPELLKGVNLCLLLSHFANADEPEDDMNLRQAKRFRAVAARFPGVCVSFANSAAAFGGLATGMARAGIALYGGNPFATRANPVDVVATLEAQVVGLRDVRPLDPVGYGGTFAAATPIRLAVLGIGYADGMPRRLTNGQVAWRGARLPVVGRVSMDLTQVDATAVADDINLGDWVEIFGATVPVDEFAQCAGTISYEALTRIGARVHRRRIAYAPIRQRAR